MLRFKLGQSHLHFFFDKVLIKMLVIDLLKKRTREHFLFWGGFVEFFSHRPKMIGKKTKLKRLFQNLEILEQGTSSVQTRRKIEIYLVPFLELKIFYTRKGKNFVEEKTPSPPQ